jgi:hypothetical protein
MYECWIAMDILSFYTVYGEHLLPQRQYDLKVRNDTTITKIKNLKEPKKEKTRFALLFFTVTNGTLESDVFVLFR